MGVLRQKLSFYITETRKMCRGELKLIERLILGATQGLEL